MRVQAPQFTKQQVINARCAQCVDTGYIWTPEGDAFPCNRCEKGSECARQDMDTTAENSAALLREVADELAEAQINWPTFNSAHEGLAVLMEEVEELKAWVFKNQSKRDLVAMRKEAIQVATVAVRFALELCSEERGRR